ncbi:MAG: tRNA (guanosine(37)-N1)-methyltransferase TrmD [Clostridia bacterium]|nr:tRNA (guanosine(37)-N1)-methyltransferase TrmD [Clostridia bacterium]
MRIDILTLFPQSIEAFLGESIIGRARKAGKLELHCHQIRDYTMHKQKQTDDYPYGGGFGMVMYADPLYRAHQAVKEDSGKEHIHTVYMSPQGQVFDEDKAKELAGYDQIILVCGHYEGVDERFLEECVDEEISLGNFVLTGGEIAAAAIADAVARLSPGVLRTEECFTDESIYDGRLEHPQYTRPEEWHGRKVPEVLFSGNHAEIKKWRQKQGLYRTFDKRPDLFEEFPLSDEERKLLRESGRNPDEVE